jgi:general secretion pathway protein D
MFPTGVRGAAPQPKPSPIAAVIQVTVIPATRAASVVHQLFPNIRVQVDEHANAIVVYGSPDEIQSARSVVTGIDVKNPTLPTIDVIQVHIMKPQDVVTRVAPLFPSATLTVASKSAVLLKATPLDGAQIKALISSLDAPPVATPAPTSAPIEAVVVKNARPNNVARAVAQQVHDVRISVSGGTLLITGDPQAVAQAKILIAQLDIPPYGSRYTDVYHLKNVDAASVGDLIHRTYPYAVVTVDKDLNAISVSATAGEHDRIAAGIAQLDGAGAGNSQGGGAAYGPSNEEVIHVHAMIPNATGASTSAQDMATAVTQALGQMATGLHLTVPANSDEIILTGDPTSVRLAKELIEKLDVVPRQVVLDTEVLEVDESTADNVGLLLPNAVLSTTFSEVQPTPDAYGNPGRINGLQPITRTALSLTAELNLQIQKGHGRVLADPRILALSGHTASIRAGDTLAILTTTGGGVGTPVTQQLQTFNTGVTLDITPQVTPDGDVIVALHPVVNSLEGISSAGIPEISTRDTQTVVHLQDNQTLIIGGLIQVADTRTISQIPILGQIPIIGKLFTNNNVNIQNNELVIVVTPHILKDGEQAPRPDASMGIPTPAPLPTLPPSTMLPTVHPTALPSTPLPAPVLYTPLPSMSPQPLPTPSAFAASNKFEYGTAPQNNYAGPQDSPQIFYARLQPTVFSATMNIAVDAVTTSNITAVTIGTPGRTVPLSQVGPGKWSVVFPASQLSLSSAQQTTFLTLSASRSDGIAATIQIPVSLNTR